MSSNGTGYDLSVTTFPPTGGVSKIEYFFKAVDHRGGCLFGGNYGVEKLILSKMMLVGSNRGSMRFTAILAGKYSTRGRIYGVDDEAKDKAFELVMSWVCDESNGKHRKVADELLEQAEEAAKVALEEIDSY